MKVSVNTLNSYLKKKLDTSEIVKIIENSEVELEEVISGSDLDSKIIVTQVLSVRKHPNADKLKLVEIDDGKKKIWVVCGAPNVKAKMKVAYAKPGTILPDKHKIEKAVIRGEESSGMLCSANELEISDDHSGILELDPDLPLGISLCDIENNGEILNVSTPANRWDFLSFEGLARELAANSSGNSFLEPDVEKINYNNREVINVKQKGECKRFVSAKLKVDMNCKSPKWLVDNLISAGMRPINPVVDITNFVMLETGQPSHAYDNKKLKGNLGVRFASLHEKITTLDGEIRTLNKADLIIYDKSGPIAIAGVMGGESTQVDESTTEILLEVANFDKTVVRKSAKKHGLRSEASSRFEKGLPLPLQPKAFERLVFLLENICKAKIIDESNDQLYSWPWVSYIGLRLRRAEKILGMKLDEAQIITGLRARGFTAEHFSLSGEVKKHIGKPYKLGANFREHGEACFDCSYLIDRIYSKIGVFVGHSALGQYHHGRKVNIDELKPGDALFIEGKIGTSATDHYYTRDGAGVRKKIELKKPLKIGHVGMYLGGDKVVQASFYEHKDGKWIKRKKAEVNIVSLGEFSKAVDYKGARRYVENFNHIIAVTAPWWRTDVRIEADLIEECAKIVGYENMPVDMVQIPISENRTHKKILELDELRQDLIANGLIEVMTYSFISEKAAQLFGSNVNKLLKIVNPLSVEQAYMRDNILASHVEVIAKNIRYEVENYGFFEFARVYCKVAGAGYKKENSKLALTSVGSDSYQRTKAVLDIIEGKYNLEFILRKTKLDSMDVCAEIMVEKEVVGLIGNVKETIIKKYKITKKVTNLELDVDLLLKLKKEKNIGLIPHYQLIERDITIEVDTKIWWQHILQELKKVEQIKKVVNVSEFCNDKLDSKNKKRISFRIVLDLGANPKTSNINHVYEKICTRLVSSKDIGKSEII